MNDYLKNKRLVSVYKGSKREESYLYVDKKEGLEKIPEALLTHFGKPAWVMDLLLSADKELARVDSEKVLENIGEQGYYLQMPPPKEEYMHIQNDKLPRA